MIKFFFKTRGVFTAVFFCLCCFSCGEATVPKPRAYLYISYPSHSYKTYNYKGVATFPISIHSTVTKSTLKNNWLNIDYPKMKATIMLTYYPVKNNLQTLLKDSEKLTFKHTIKADEISSQKFEKATMKATLFEVTGDAASNIQFNIRKSKKHFITGALYFYAKPNYDSLMPAIEYLKKDIIHLIEGVDFY